MGRWSRMLALGTILVTITFWLVRPATAADENAWSVESVFSSVVLIHADIPEEARTATALGSKRAGNGVIIDNDGLIVTIGYLILEAEQVRVTDAEGKTSAATLIGYDHDTGFGLIRSEEPLGGAALPLGSAADLEAGEPVIVAGRGSQVPMIPAVVASRRPFAGYWEYLLDAAIFTQPPFPSYGGAALVAADGRLVGIGSLFVGDAVTEGERSPGNMFVPIDGLRPILADMLSEGRRTGPAQPWLGVHAREVKGRVFVTRLADGGPAEAAGLGAGDLIVGVEGRRIGGLVDLWRRVHGAGSAGVEIGLDVVRRGGSELTVERVPIASADRHNWLRLKAPDN